MFAKNGKLYADAFKYLRHKRRNEVALQLRADADDYFEEDMNPLEVSVSGDMIKFGTWFVVTPEKFDYGSIKKAVIQLRYSNDDQMALMLNRENSEESQMYFDKMQSWREFATAVAKKAMEQII